jgi:hypothetical protein
VAAALCKGDVEESDAMLRFVADDLTFRVARPTVAAGVDGDGVSLAPPLHFRSIPGALSVLALPAPGAGDDASS